MSVAIIVLTLLVIIVASWFSLWKLYSIMKGVDKKLTLILRQLPKNSNNEVSNPDDTSN
jgi:uncharacterized membrane protein YcjF (UPF0283 family)